MFTTEVLSAFNPALLHFSDIELFVMVVGGTHQKGFTLLSNNKIPQRVPDT